MVKKPIIYLYGNDQIPFPELPKWDDKTLPCAAIVETMYEYFELWVSDILSADDSNLYCGGNYQRYVIHGTEFVAVNSTSASAMIHDIVWANCNIYYDNWGSITDELVFGKSDDPVLDATERSYNLFAGMLAPALPELHYEHTVINETSDSLIVMFCSDDPYILERINDNGEKVFNVDAVDVTARNDKTRSYACTGAGWKIRPTYENHASHFYGELIWSTHDISYPDGNPYIEGTMPEAPDIEPSAPEVEPKRHKPLPFMEGLRIGQFVRAMRK